MGGKGVANMKCEGWGWEWRGEGRKPEMPRVVLCGISLYDTHNPLVENLLGRLDPSVDNVGRQSHRS